MLFNYSNNKFAGETTGSVIAGSTIAGETTGSVIAGSVIASLYQKGMDEIPLAGVDSPLGPLPP